MYKRILLATIVGIMCANLLLISGCGTADNSKQKTTSNVQEQTEVKKETKEVTTEETKETQKQEETKKEDETKQEETKSNEESTQKTVVPKDSEENDFKTAEKKQCMGVLDGIEKNTKADAEDLNSDAVVNAAYMMNWAVGTTLSPEEIKEVTNEWLSTKQINDDLKGKFKKVKTAYQQLLKPGQEELLSNAGCKDSCYPWSDGETLEPVDVLLNTVESK